VRRLPAPANAAGKPASDAGGYRKAGCENVAIGCHGVLLPRKQKAQIPVSTRRELSSGSSQVFWLVSSEGRDLQRPLPPSPSFLTSGDSEAAFSLTAAGPLRCFTGFPVALGGQPEAKLRYRGQCREVRDATLGCRSQRQVHCESANSRLRRPRWFECRIPSVCYAES
jgi:hypothetical protein